MRQQRTLRHVIGCAGVGLHSGARVALTLRPAPEGSGIRFRRVDRPGAPAVAALPRNAHAADGALCLAAGGGGSVRMVERLLAAMAVCRIDNVLVEISGDEPPVMDGTALPFVRLVECAGVVEQSAPVATLEVVRPIEVAEGKGFARLDPPGEPAASEHEAPLDLPAETGRSAPQALLDALGALALLPAQVRARYSEDRATTRLRCALVRALVAEPRNFRLSGLGVDAVALPAGAAWQLAS